MEIRDGPGTALPTGQVGELCARAEGVTAGYGKNPEPAAQVLRDGWVHTGDLGRLDERRHLTVVDRIDSADAP
ncbi:hypothetical protein [Kitasatospora sp. SolWspMP-SS2h]|uniref:hypothetical protein n=1 Tax=Kitasatospora sp. SolWspMP-SS2h TaxID=1305729 RepID=UPI00351A53DC